MTVLVTGATGRIGSRLVPRLLDHGETVRVLARDRLRAEPLADRGAEVVEGDLRHDGPLERALDGVDRVVHLAAAFRRVPDEEAVAVNREATRDLGRACVSAGVERIVFASTNLVYGPGRRRRTARGGSTPRRRRPPSGSCRGCTAMPAWIFGCCDWLSSTATAIRTWLSCCLGPATGRPTSGFTSCTTPTSRRRSLGRCAPTILRARRSTSPTTLRSAPSRCWG